MNRNPIVCFALAIFACCSFLVASCAATPIDELDSPAFQRRERLAYLVAKETTVALVRRSPAAQDDLERAAGAVEQYVGGDLVAALAAAGLDAELWEIPALLVQEVLEPRALEPGFARLTAAAARGVRDGASGIAPQEQLERESLERAETRAESSTRPLAGANLGGRQIVQDYELARARAELRAAG